MASHAVDTNLPHAILDGLLGPSDTSELAELAAVADLTEVTAVADVTEVTAVAEVVEVAVDVALEAEFAGCFVFGAAKAKTHLPFVSLLSS